MGFRTRAYRDNGSQTTAPSTPQAAKQLALSGQGLRSNLLSKSTILVPEPLEPKAPQAKGYQLSSQRLTS